MKTLTLHTNSSQPTLRNEWCGIRMFSTFSNPAQANLGIRQHLIMARWIIIS